jgi:hypothetical protein
VAVEVESVTSRLLPGKTSIFVTERVCLDLEGTPWQKWLQPVDVRPTSPRLAGIAIYRLGKGMLESHELPTGAC